MGSRRKRRRYVRHTMEFREEADEPELQSALFRYIELFYNRRRRHSTLGYESPAQFEENYYAAQAA